MINMDYKRRLSNINNNKTIKLKNNMENKLIKLFEDDFKIKIAYTNKVNVSNDNKKSKKNKFTQNINKLIEILPFNLERMEKENIKFLLTSYSLITLLNNKKCNNKKDYDMETITGINIVIEEKTEEQAIEYVLNKIKIFFKEIDIPIIIKEGGGKTKYFNKGFNIGLLDYKNKKETIIRCSILDKKIIKNFELSEEMQSKIIFDIVLNEMLLINILEYGKRQE